MRELERRRSERFVPLTGLAVIYTGLGEKDRALDLLEKALEERELFFSQLKDDSLFNNLRSEPRFQNIFERMNLDNSRGSPHH